MSQNSDSFKASKSYSKARTLLALGVIAPAPIAGGLDDDAGDVGDVGPGICASVGAPGSLEESDVEESPEGISVWVTAGPPGGAAG